MKMTKQTKAIFHVEGPDWKTIVELDADVFESEAEQLFEAGTLAVEYVLTENDETNIGAILLVKKNKSTKEAMVNSYICLNNAGQYELAEELRTNFKKQSGQDLALDQNGYSY